MCNRYSAQRKEQIRLMVLKQFGLTLAEDWEPSVNIPPTSRVPVVWHDGHARTGLLRWGTQTPMGLVMNARAETLLEKPLWKPAVANRRCILLADGFFEFEDRGRRKQAHYFTVRGKEVFGIAGIWLPANDSQPDRCVMVTTTPNPLVEPYHNRMPSILDDIPAKDWLGSEPLPPGRIRELCRPFSEDRMDCWLAPPEVNSASYQGPAAILPYQPQPELF